MIRNGRENSRPEKGMRNRRWIRLSSQGAFVVRPLFSAAVSDLAAAFSAAVCLSGRVSGRYAYRYAVSVTMSSSEKPAAVAKGLATTVVMLARAAPSVGPNVKAILKHAPTIAIVEPLCDSSLMSAAMAVANWIFPSLRPPTIRLHKNVRKSVAAHQRATLAMLPAMLHKSAVRRPYLSEARPMMGEANAWRREKREPRAPPRRTMSYLELIGIEKDCL